MYSYNNVSKGYYDVMKQIGLHELCQIYISYGIKKNYRP